jgi:hypothetical protein
MAVYSAANDVMVGPFDELPAGELQETEIIGDRIAATKHKMVIMLYLFKVRSVSRHLKDPNLSIISFVPIFRKFRLLIPYRFMYAV